MLKFLFYCGGFIAIFSFLAYLIPQLVISFLPVKNLVKRYGKSWALITGASQGIGKAFAQTLGKQV